MRHELEPDAMRKVQSMGNLHTSFHTVDGMPSLARVGEMEQLEEPSCVEDREAEEGYASDSTVPATASSRERKKGVPWTEDEHRLFLLGLQKLGKGDWRGISRHFVQSRTPTQVASHAQKYFIRQNNLNKRKRRSSLFDIVSDAVGPRPPSSTAAATKENSHPTSSAPAVASMPQPTGFSYMGHPPPPFPMHMPRVAATGSFAGSLNAKTAERAAEGEAKPTFLNSALQPSSHTAAVPPFHDPRCPLPLPWSYPGIGAYHAAAKSISALSLGNNPKLCKPTATLATRANWPLRFPFPGIPESEVERVASTSPPSHVAPLAASAISPSQQTKETTARPHKDSKSVVDGSYRGLAIPI